MIHQLNLYGKDKVEVAIERFRAFEPKEGYYLAFSGGKDSCVIKALADMAGVKYDAHYNITSVDPPELVRFVKEQHPDVSRDYPRDKDGKVITMWNLIPTKSLPPTRLVRYCCASLKESQGTGRFVVTGVRKAESAKRSHRGGIEVADTQSGKHEIYDVDNMDEQMMHTCQLKRKRILNPIIDWTEEDVWEFIHEYDVPYCSLYDEGKKRLGCIACPMQGGDGQLADLERYPKYRQNYLRAFDRMMKNAEANGKVYDTWHNADDVMKWWIGVK